MFCVCMIITFMEFHTKKKIKIKSYIQSYIERIKKNHPKYGARDGDRIHDISFYHYECCTELFMFFCLYILLFGFIFFRVHFMLHYLI